jgi:hypothetical protein
VFLLVLGFAFSFSLGGSYTPGQWIFIKLLVFYFYGISLLNLGIEFYCSYLAVSYSSGSGSFFYSSILTFDVLLFSATGLLGFLRADFLSVDFCGFSSTVFTAVNVYL